MTNLAFMMDLLIVSTCHRIREPYGVDGVESGVPRGRLVGCLTGTAGGKSVGPGRGNIVVVVNGEANGDSVGGGPGG